MNQLQRRFLGPFSHSATKIGSFTGIGSASAQGLPRLPQERFSRRDPYPGYPLKPSDVARDPASGVSGSGVEASPHSLKPAPYNTRCRKRFDPLRFPTSTHGGKMKQKGGPTNTEHCFQQCSAWPGIGVHLTEESAFTFPGIRKPTSSVSPSMAQRGGAATKDPPR